MTSTDLSAPSPARSDRAFYLYNGLLSAGALASSPTSC
jgi:hypothetical protein